MKIKDLPENERPREKMLALGAESLSSSELLAVLLGSGTGNVSAIGLAEKILSLDPSGLRYLAIASPEELSEVPGIGTAKASVLIAAAELGRRIAASGHEGRRIECTRDVVDICMEKMRYRTKEHFDVLLLNSKGCIIREENVSVGDLSSSIVHPREAFKDAVRSSAAGVVFVHNHPSGDPEPSEEDVAVTERLCEAGRILGINVLDHVIIGDGTYTSFKNQGLIE